MFDSGYYTSDELRKAGFKSVGENVVIAKNCTIVGLGRISLASNIRIDSYCTILATGKADITIGSFVHIGGYCLLAGAAGVTLEDFSGLSHGTCVYTGSDDYTGKYLTNPTVPQKYTGVKTGPVHLGRHVIIGAGTVILPGVIAGEGASVGALSLVMKRLDPWTVYFGSPAKRVKERKKDLLELERQLLEELGMNRIG